MIKKGDLVFYRSGSEMGQGLVDKVLKGRRNCYFVEGLMLLRKDIEPLPNESRLHAILVQQLQKKYPNVLFRSDNAHKNYNAFQKDGVAWPDLFIAEQRWHYQGFFLEIKLTKDHLYKKDGSLRENEHIKRQDWTLAELRHRGYAAIFGCGFDECWGLITIYLENISKWKN